MTCDKYLDMALEEIDGELEESRSLLLMRHLVSCESCRIYYEKHSRLFDMMKEDVAGDLIAVPESFSSSVMAGIELGDLQISAVSNSSASLASKIISRIKSIRLVPASLYPVAALSAVLIVVVAGLRYDNTDVKSNPPITLSNAMAIKAVSIDKKVLKPESDKDELAYYLSRHEAKTYSSKGRSISRNTNIIYTNYNAGNR